MGDKEYPQSNLELTVLASVYRRKSLPARDAGFTVEDICMLSESWAPADFSVHLSEYGPHRDCLF